MWRMSFIRLVSRAQKDVASFDMLDSAVSSWGRRFIENSILSFAANLSIGLSMSGLL